MTMDQVFALFVLGAAVPAGGVAQQVTAPKLPREPGAPGAAEVWVKVSDQMSDFQQGLLKAQEESRRVVAEKSAEYTKILKNHSQANLLLMQQNREITADIGAIR